MSDDDATRARHALESLKQALDGHLEAVLARSGEADPEVQVAYDRLREAAARYDDTLFDGYDEVTPFLFGEEPTALPVEGPADAAPRVAVLLRRDYALGADVAVEEAAATVGALVEEHGVDGFDERAEEAGLEPVGGTVWVVTATDAGPFASPFTAAVADRLLQRLDEVYED